MVLIMPKARATTVIATSRDRAFDFLLNGENNIEWRTNVVDIRHVDGPKYAPGAVYVQTLRGPLGLRIRGDYRITDAIAPELIRFEVIAGPARPIGTFRIEPSRESHIQVTFTLHFDPRGFQRLLGPAIQRQMNLEVAALSRLKEVLEAGPNR
jgi:hypothetical protein